MNPCRPFRQLPSPRDISPRHWQKEERRRKGIQHNVPQSGHMTTDSGTAVVCVAAYYLPPSSVKVPLAKTGRKTWCEWKGMATYYSLRLDGLEDVGNRIWTYEAPTAGFEPIRGFLSFYAGPWDCFVDGEQVVPQPGDFYGGWVTAELQGIVKGRTGNRDPIV